MTLRTAFTIGLAATMLVFVGAEAASAQSNDSKPQKPTDFWNYSQTGAKTANTSPGVAPRDLATLFTSVSGVGVGDRPAASFYTPEALRAMSQSWAAKGRLLSGPSHLPDVFERTVAAHVAAQPNVSVYPDAFERAVQAKLATQPTVSVYPDAFERAVANRIESGPLVGHRDRYEVDLPSGPVATTTTGSGREIEWPQIGIGFGIGLALVLGLILAMRLTRGRQLAHG